MNFNDPSEFGKAFSRLVVDPAEIREAFEADQKAEDAYDLNQAKVFKHPDGEHFEVAYVRDGGERVTTTGRWISVDEWRQCSTVPMGKQDGGNHG